MLDEPIQQPKNKRKALPELANEEEFIDSLLPGATAVKRRRIELGEPGDRETPPVVQRQSPSPVEPKEVNVKSVIQERRRAEDKATSQDQENIHQVLQGMSVEEMKNLAIVETIQIKPRSFSRDTARWDDRWNGRKNFKQFRKRSGAAGARRGPGTIVPLVEYQQRRDESSRPLFGDLADSQDGESEENGAATRPNTTQASSASSGRAPQSSTNPLGPVKRKRFAAAQMSDDSQSEAEDSIRSIRSSRRFR